MGVDPTIWGLKMWTMIHLICLQAPETIDTNVRNAFYTFFTMMPYVLPCDKCREHWLEHVREQPLEQMLDTREQLFRWSVNMHNLVNKSLGKPEISYDSALKHWTSISRGDIPSTQCIDTGNNVGIVSFSKNNRLWMIFLLISIIVIVCMFVFVLKRM